MGQLTYKNPASGGRYIWYGGVNWYITTGVGFISAYWWLSDHVAGNVLDTYTPQGTATGTATVSQT
jgi:hypothetical protein